jgi:hypothetical protein
MENMEKIETFLKKSHRLLDDLWTIQKSTRLLAVFLGNRQRFFGRCLSVDFRGGQMSMPQNDACSFNSLSFPEPSSRRMA